MHSSIPTIHIISLRQNIFHELISVNEISPVCLVLHNLQQFGRLYLYLNNKPQVMTQCKVIHLLIINHIDRKSYFRIKTDNQIFTVTETLKYNIVITSIFKIWLPLICALRDLIKESKSDE